MSFCLFVWNNTAPIGRIFIKFDIRVFFFFFRKSVDSIQVSLTPDKELYVKTYMVIQEESALLWDMIVWVILSKKVRTNMGPILNGYGDMTAWNLE